jgi:hypothetical protein
MNSNSALEKIVIMSRYMGLDERYLDSYFSKNKSKRYLCKVCGEFHTKKSDKKNVCIECRKEYLERNGK